MALQLRGWLEALYLDGEEIPMLEGLNRVNQHVPEGYAVILGYLQVFEVILHIQELKEVNRHAQDQRDLIPFVRQ